MISERHVAVGWRTNPVKPGRTGVFMIHVFPADVRVWDVADLRDANNEMEEVQGPSDHAGCVFGVWPWDSLREEGDLEQDARWQGRDPGDQIKLGD